MEQSSGKNGVTFFSQTVCAAFHCPWQKAEKAGKMSTFVSRFHFFLLFSLGTLIIEATVCEA